MACLNASLALVNKYINLLKYFQKFIKSTGLHSSLVFLIPLVVAALESSPKFANKSVKEPFTRLGLAWLGFGWSIELDKVLLIDELIAFFIVPPVCGGSVTIHIHGCMICVTVPPMGNLNRFVTLFGVNGC